MHVERTVPCSVEHNLQDIVRTNIVTTIDLQHELGRNNTEAQDGIRVAPKNSGNTCIFGIYASGTVLASRVLSALQVVVHFLTCGRRMPRADYLLAMHIVNHLGHGDCICTSLWEETWVATYGMLGIATGQLVWSAYC